MTSSQDPRRRSAAGPADIQPVEDETLDRVLTGPVTVVPLLAPEKAPLACHVVRVDPERHRRELRAAGQL